MKMKVLNLVVLSILIMGGVTRAAENVVLPKDVQDYMENRIGCNHLAGEEFSNPSRSRMMAKELRECGFGDLKGVPASTMTVVTIDTVEKRLRKKYKNQPQILRSTDSAKAAKSMMRSFIR